MWYCWGLLLDALLLLPLALQPTVGFGLSNNVLPFFPICHQLSSSSHSQHLISFYFLFPSFPGFSPCSRPFQFLSEDLLGHPILPSILSRWPNQLILCPFIHFTIFSPLLISSSSRFVRLFHSPFSYFGPYSSRMRGSPNPVFWSHCLEQEPRSPFFWDATPRLWVIPDVSWRKSDLVSKVDMP